ncbi:hypothetical protein C0J52_25428 [Blattella germanica]|nr:hypothetical protein C0J52_25428 [Blattella germanica]
MTEKARVVLKSGRLLTSAQSSMCGINLNVEETYLITGRVYAGKARISLCGFHQPWNQLTIRQKKGFRLLYRQGCNCECPKESSPSDICAWETSSYSDSSSLHDCQQKHAVCMKTVSGGCGWSVDKKYRECMKTRRLMRKEKLDNEP